MKKPIKNEQIENLAHKVADAINTVDKDLYSYLMCHSEQLRSSLPNWVNLAFRDRVRHLVDNPDEISL